MASIARSTELEKRDMWMGEEGGFPLPIFTVQGAEERVSVDCHNAGASGRRGKSFESSHAPASTWGLLPHPHLPPPAVPAFSEPVIVIYFCEGLQVHGERGRSDHTHFVFFFGSLYLLQ